MSNQQKRKMNSLKANRGGTRKSGQQAVIKGSELDYRDIVVRSLKAGSTETLIKRLTRTGFDVTNAANGLIDVAYLRASQVTAANEWVAYATRFSSYRVRSVKRTWFSCITSTEPIAGESYGSCLFMGTFGVNPPSGAVNILSDGEFEAGPTVGAQPFSMACTWNKNPAAKLYTSILSTIPALSDFGVAYASHPSRPIGLTLTSTPIYVSFAEWIVEFKDPI